MNNPSIECHHAISCDVMSTMSLRLPDELHDALRAQAAAEHVSANELAVRVLSEALDVRKQRRDEAIARITRSDAEIFTRLAR